MILVLKNQERVKVDLLRLSSESYFIHTSFTTMTSNPNMSAPAPNLTADATAGGPTTNVGAQPVATLPASAPSVAPPMVLPKALLAIAQRKALEADKVAQQIRDVGQMIMAPSAARMTSATGDQGMTDKILVPILPEGTPDMVQRLWALRLAAAFRSNRELEIRAAAGVLIALFYVLYPDTTKQTRDTEWVAYTLTTSEVTNIRTIFTNGKRLPPIGKTPDGKDDGVLLTALSSLNSSASINHTLPLGIVTSSYFETSQDWLMFHGYLGLLLFTMHKDAKSGSGKALLESRPLALQKKYSKSESQYVLWSDIGRPQSAAYTACTAVWKIIPQTRLTLMSEFVTSSSGMISAEREALFTTVRLMRWTDMSHVVIIQEALNTFPYLAACPDLVGDLQFFAAGMRQIYEMMPEYTDPITRQRVKDVTSMPYIKALWGDRKSIAQRNTMPLLLAVAVKMLTESRPTLRGYAGPTGYQTKIDSITKWHDEIVEYMSRDGM